MTNSQEHFLPGHDSEKALTSTISLQGPHIYGTPGASLENVASFDADAVSAGQKGEAVVGEELERLAAMYPNTYVFHSLKLPIREGDMDHVVVQGDTILLVDSKNWKHKSSYQIVEASDTYSIINRDGAPFMAGDVSLPRYIKDWRRNFSGAKPKVKAVLVIANRESVILPARARPYHDFTNLDGLAAVFANTFKADPSPAMKASHLKFFTSMLQSTDGTFTAPQKPARMSKFASRERIWTTTKWLIAWCAVTVLAYVFIFPVSFLPNLILVAVGHIHYAKLKRFNLKGQRWMKAVLVATYAMLAIWAVVIVFLLVMGVF